MKTGPIISTGFRPLEYPGLGHILLGLLITRPIDKPDEVVRLSDLMGIDWRDGHSHPEDYYA